MNNDALFEQMVQRLGGQLKGLMGQVQQGAVSASLVEGLIRQQLWEFGRQTAAVMLEAADRAAVGDRAVHDHRTRTVVTLFGAVDITRSRCRDGSYPLDEALGLEGQQGWTIWVQEAVSLVSCDCGFENTADLMQRLLGLSLSTPSAQQIAEQAGQRAEELGPTPPPQPAAGKTLIVAVDGCQAPQRDGWHEVKVAAIYANESRCKTAAGRSKVMGKEYLATLEDAAGFGQLVRQRTEDWQADRARRLVMMGDGAPWIWNLAEEHFPQAVEIVDFYHAMEHLWATSEAVFGDRERSPATRGWVRHYGRHLRRGRVDLVIAAMQRGQAGGNLSGERAEVLRRNLDYFKTNQHRMRYDQYRRWRLPIGTGIVEGSCKFVVQSRFKRPGCRWSAEGLRQMLELKLMRLNRRWEQLWPHLQAA